MPCSSPPLEGDARKRAPDRSRRRAAILAGVYVLMFAHWLHWRLNGTSLAPLELNEVMHTLELGVITAGFLFMLAATVSVLIFGRFFCSWGCHILALEDLSAWLLGKLRIRPRLVRSRALLLVPLGAMSYMFLWPQCKRLTLAFWPDTASILGSMPPFEWRVLAQDTAWASFITQDYARNLPPAGVAVFTFVVVGAVMVYFLGTRAFCRLACPYGAAFALVDRVSPGRIVLDGPCTGCGHCTAACTSHVRVHEETQAFGKVVDAGCLKDLDCVAACPQGSLRFGFSTPALFSRPLHAPKPARFDLSVGEDVLVGAVFVVMLLIWRGLYEVVPFLLALGIAGLSSVAVLVLWRLTRRREVVIAGRMLKSKGRMHARGRLAASGAVMLTLLGAHSGVVRWSEWRAASATAEVVQVQHDGGGADAALMETALRHLERRAHWGLAASRNTDEQIVAVAAAAQQPARAVPALERMVQREPQRAELWRALGEACATAGQWPRAVAAMQQAVSIEPSFASWHDLACIQSAVGNARDAESSFRRASALNPADADTHRALAQLLDARGAGAEAEAERQTARRLDAARD